MKTLIICLIGLLIASSSSGAIRDDEELPPPTKLVPKGYSSLKNASNSIDLYSSGEYLYINFNESLENVIIEITDDFGSLVYFDQIDSYSGYSLNIDCGQYSGTYTITIINSEGNLLLEDTYLF